MSDTDIGADTDFLGAPAFIVNGSLTIAEAEVVGRHIFYNNSHFDDPDHGYSDNDAIAPDKSALLPGNTATFENYTSSFAGINGVFVDIQNLIGTPTTDDFEFRMGNDDNPGAWQHAPTPLISVLEGDGVGGADRIRLIWGPQLIIGTWLQVKVLTSSRTGLPIEDTFYFGNAPGEAGDSDAVAFVDGTDFALARDNPRGFFNPAPIDFRYDYNRDSFVDGLDLAIARDRNTNFVTALRLITPESPDNRPILPRPPSLRPNVLPQSAPVPAEQMVRSLENVWIDRRKTWDRNSIGERGESERKSKLQPLEVDSVF